MIVAVDPGHEGGAVLLDAGLPIAWWRWRQLDRKSGPAHWCEASFAHERRECRTLARVGELLAFEVRHLLGGRDYHLVAEGLFVHRKASAATAIDLGKSVGWLTAGLREDALTFQEPLASLWRPAVLGCAANASSDASEALALELWKRAWRGQPIDDPHVAEAYCQARWRLVQLGPLGRVA